MFEIALIFFPTIKCFLALRYLHYGHLSNLFGKFVELSELVVWWIRKDYSKAWYHKLSELKPMIEASFPTRAIKD